jgi:hypothetical protein
MAPGAHTQVMGSYGRRKRRTSAPPVVGFGRVHIPLSFQTADLGVVLPGQHVYLTYRLQLEVALGAGAEIATASISDPFHLSGYPLLGTLRAVLAVSAVPEPGTLALAASGLLALLGSSALARRPRG